METTITVLTSACKFSFRMTLTLCVAYCTFLEWLVSSSSSRFRWSWDDHICFEESISNKMLRYNFCSLENEAIHRFQLKNTIFNGNLLRLEKIEQVGWTMTFSEVLLAFNIVLGLFWVHKMSLDVKYLVFTAKILPIM